MKNEMNANNFKTLIEALEALPEGIRNNKVNMSSVDEPVCGTVGCFAGLISIVAKEIPELKKLYASKHIYFFHAWVDALNEYLDINFREWAEENPEIWGNEDGWHMFYSITAFGKGAGDVLSHDEIIVFLRNAYDRWIDFENDKKEKIK
jgi:hypothetical protein